jgi:hypothetical protein
VRSAAFGWPVLPLVKVISAGAEGSRAAIGSSSFVFIALEISRVPGIGQVENDGEIWRRDGSQSLSN